MCWSCTSWTASSGIWLEQYVRELEDHGAGLVCTQQPIDTTNPISGKIVLAVMAALAGNLPRQSFRGDGKGQRRPEPPLVCRTGTSPMDISWPRPNLERGASNRAIAVIVPEEAEAVRQAFLVLLGKLRRRPGRRMLNDAGYTAEPGSSVGYPFTDT